MGFSRQEYWSGVPFPSPEEISSLYNSIVFLYFFALITEGSDSFTSSSLLATVCPCYFSLPSGFDGEGNGTPLQYSCLENPMNGGAWKAAVHGIAEGWTQLSDFPFTFHFHALEKEIATHSRVLAWRIPGMGDPGGLPSMGSHRVRHD